MEVDEAEDDVEVGGPVPGHRHADTAQPRHTW